MLRNEVPSTWNAVVLSETRLVFVDALVLELVGHFGLHVNEHDLVDVSGWCRNLGLASLLVLLVARCVATTALSCGSHFLFYFISIDYNKQI